MLSRWLERFWITIAWHLPRGLVYWCAIRVFVNGTQGKYSNQEVPGLTVATALQRWEKK